MRSGRQLVTNLLAITLLCAVGPFVMEEIGFRFLPLSMGGVGDHVAGYRFDHGIVRLDLILAFAGSLGLALVISARCKPSRTYLTLILSTTMAVAAIVGSVQIVDVSAGGHSTEQLRHSIHRSSQLAHVMSAMVLLCGCALLHVRSQLGSRVSLVAVVGMGAAALAAGVSPLRHHPLADSLVSVSPTLLVAIYVATAALLTPLLRRRPLSHYTVAVMAGLLPLVLSQGTLLRIGLDIEVMAANRTAVLVWCAYLVPLLGLSIDLVLGAENDARGGERRFLRAVLDALPNIVYTRDEDGRYGLLNRAAAAYLGGTPDELEGTIPSGQDHDPIALKHASIERRIIASRRTVRHPGLRIADADGQDRWLQILMQPLDTDNCSSPQVLGVATDVTRAKVAEQVLERRLANEKTLRRSLSRLLRTPVTEFEQAITNVLAEVGDALDADSIFVYEFDHEADQATRRTTWAASEKTPIPPLQKMKYVRWALDALQTGEAAIFSSPDHVPDDPAVIDRTRKLGIKFIILVPVFDKDGELWGTLGAHLPEAPDDNGAALRHVLGYLADVYTAVRGRYLAETELQHATRVAEESARAKGDFLANMSHEIRTPLNAVIGLADILQGLQPTLEQAHYLTMVQQAGDSLLSLINDILDLSRIEAGECALDPVAIDLPSLVTEVVDMMAYHAQQQGLELVSHLAPDTRVQAHVDPVRLKQVLINLLNNAIKFTEEGHVSLRVDRERDDDGTTWYRFTVADTGIGIPRDLQALIFQKFTQADASHTRRYGGTGLGLTICRHLVQLMGGTVAVDSKPGYGTRFTVALPLASEVLAAAAPLPDPQLRGHSYLAVMPGPAARENLATHMSELGLNGTALANAVALQAHLQRQDVDIVLADAQIDATELDTVRRVVHDHEPRPRLVLLAPLGNNHDAATANKNWDAVVRKPAQHLKLRTALQSLLHPDTEPHPTPPPPAVSTNLSHTRVLLVEDNIFNQKVAARLLETLGCRVDVAKDGRCGLDLASDHVYDLVLMDCQMPVMDGLEATLRIRALPAPHGQVPIVAMTANVAGENRDQCLAAGMNDFASKPINKKTLSSVVEKWAGSREPESVS